MMSRKEFMIAFLLIVITVHSDPALDNHLLPEFR